MKKLFFVSAISVFAIAGCSKYQDGPLVDFESLTSRASNNWVIDMAFMSTSATTDTITGQVHFEIDMSDNNTATYIDTTVADNAQQVTTEQGSWAFTTDKSSIVLLLNGNTDTKVWQILRLTDTQLWVLQKQGNNYYQYNLRPKK